jgi:hypothetical protein
VRLGLVLLEGREGDLARLAETHGLFGVMAGWGNPMTAVNAAVYASTATEFVRIAVLVRLGLEHPITLAEELSILDNVNNGRTVVIADTGDLDAEAAADEVAVLREALASRPIRYEGVRWKVPAGLPANVTAPKSISVTPKPAQLEVPFWVTGPHAARVARMSRLPLLARNPSEVREPMLVQPGVTAIKGDLVPDRAQVTEWAAASVTHLFIELPTGVETEKVMTLVSRYLGPEVGMPHFPRVMSDSRVPLPWPGEGRK